MWDENRTSGVQHHAQASVPVAVAVSAMMQSDHIHVKNRSHARLLQYHNLAACPYPFCICVIFPCSAEHVYCRGYTPMCEETLDPQHSRAPDTHEGIYYGREVPAGSQEAKQPLHGPNQWPPEVCVWALWVDGPGLQAVGAMTHPTAPANRTADGSSLWC